MQAVNTSLAVETIADFDAVYHSYQQAVYANIFKMVRHPQSAEDILQEVFLSLWKNKDKVTADRVAGWLFVVSYNKAATYLRHRLKLSLVRLDDPAHIENIATDDASPDTLYQAQLSLIEDALQHLPARKKEAFHLHYFEGRSYEEIASLLGISIGSVKDYIKQAGIFIRKYTNRNYDAAITATISLLLLCTSVPA
ncbi:RNA polymerase sigma factor [Puia dinghuensis]|uniref:RNA polymerase sigma factor n=1 Tax=Puia dinghuensis TaxID=1792502 RepID=A0A8J2UE23_9BACT|nr:sigma-70 family RNA polymerase sigma factor [Puia dinghuensis]GGB04785.1 RNA polymerase sigma factor [Puia dinghuensis]